MSMCQGFDHDYEERNEQMKMPHEVMGENYCGPSKVIPLGHIRNEDGFRFIGIDREGGEHYCIVRKGDSNSYYMSSNTITFQELCGWIPDTQAPSDSGVKSERT